jgi:hypothetical protein
MWIGIIFARSWHKCLQRETKYLQETALYETRKTIFWHAMVKISDPSSTTNLFAYKITRASLKLSVSYRHKTEKHA